MKKLRSNCFGSRSQSNSLGMLLAITVFSTALAFAIVATALPITCNGSFAANGLTAGGNWTEGSPFSSTGAGAYADLLLTLPVDGPKKSAWLGVNS